MKRVSLVVLAAVSAWLGMVDWSGAAELGTAFSYQGRLRLEGLPLNEACDLQFGLWTAGEGGSQVGSTLTVAGVLPSGGEFTAELDFGAGAFAGAERWLEVAVRCPAGSGGYTTLAPRQRLLAAPYALYAPAAGEAATAQSAPWAGLGGMPAGFADGVDNDTQYSAGSGLQLSGTTLSIPSQGVQNGMLANNAVTTGKILDGTVAAVDLAAGAGSEGQFLKVGSGGTLTWADYGLNLPEILEGPYYVAMIQIYNQYAGQAGAIYANSHGPTILATTDSDDDAAVYGKNNNPTLGEGVVGISRGKSAGVHGSSENSDGYGVWGTETNSANYGYLGSDLYGAYGYHDTSDNYGYLGSQNWGVWGQNKNKNFGFLGGFYYGVWGEHYDAANRGYLGSANYGAYGEYDYGQTYGYLGSSLYGAYGEHDHTGNYGYLGSSGWGVYGSTGDNTAVGYMGGEDGVYGRINAGLANRYAGYFNGPVYVKGLLTKAGGGFRIDHPLDPAGRYLSHSFVESPDMKNVYDGVAVLDGRGEAEVVLPEWFEALNRDFRYQLTCIGGFAPVYIATKISGNRFRIAGGSPGLEVSWQVTGIRKDAWAEANRLVVEEDKPAEDQGWYMHPELYGQPAEKSIDRRIANSPKHARPAPAAAEEPAPR